MSDIPIHSFFLFIFLRKSGMSNMESMYDIPLMTLSMVGRMDTASRLGFLPVRPSRKALILSIGSMPIQFHFAK